MQRSVSSPAARARCAQLIPGNVGFIPARAEIHETRSIGAGLEPVKRIAGNTNTRSWPTPLRAEPHLTVDHHYYFVARMSMWRSNITGLQTHLEHLQFGVATRMPKPYGILGCLSPEPSISLLFPIEHEVGGAYELLLFRMDKRNLRHGSRPLLTQFRVSASRLPGSRKRDIGKKALKSGPANCIGARSEIDVKPKVGEDISKPRHDQGEEQRMILGGIGHMN